MCKVADEPNGNVKVTRNGHSLVLRPGDGRDVMDTSTLMNVRHFLRDSDSAEKPEAPAGEHLLVVIDHSEARVFRSLLHGSVPQQIEPYDPHGFGRHRHNIHDHAKGQHHPVPKSFFEDVSKTLQGSNQILIFGLGSGGGSAMNELLADLLDHHKDLLANVVGTKVVDEQHLTDDQLLALAREFYETKFRPALHSTHPGAPKSGFALGSTGGS
jgi:hypothetical protein